jgi:hypothetical protein
MFSLVSVFKKCIDCFRPLFLKSKSPTNTKHMLHKLNHNNSLQNYGYTWLENLPVIHTMIYERNHHHVAATTPTTTDIAASFFIELQTSLLFSSLIFFRFKVPQFVDLNCPQVERYRVLHFCDVGWLQVLLWLRFSRQGVVLQLGCSAGW